MYVMFFWANALPELGRYGEAAAACERLLEVEPDHEDALYLQRSITPW